MSLKRTLSQSEDFPAKRINTGVRRCLIVDCPYVPSDSNVKCAECSAKFCNVRICTNLCKPSPTGKRKFKRCEAHARRASQSGALVHRAKKSVEVGMTVSESHIREAEHTTVEKRSDIQRQYQRGVIVGEQEVRHEKSETHTLRVTLINCVKNYMDTRTTEMFGGAPHNELTVASSAIQVACRDPDNVFPDVEFHDIPFLDALKLGVRRLKELHNKAMELLKARNEGTAPDPTFVLPPALSPAFAAALTPALDLTLDPAPNDVQLSAESGPTEPKLSMPAVQPLMPEVAQMKPSQSSQEDSQASTQYSQDSQASTQYSQNSQNSQDSVASRSLTLDCTEERPFDLLDLRGSLVPLVLADQLKQVKEAMYEVCDQKGLHPLYALHATAYHAWSSMLDALSRVFVVWPQHLPTNQKIESQQFKDINTALKHQELPSIKNKPDWTCGLSKQHFEALGFLTNKNGAWIWSLLDCVNRLHFDSTLYYSWVASSQLKARCAYDKLGELGLKKTFHFINTSVNALPPAIMCFTSPSLSMHVVNSEHEDVAARVRISESLIPPSKNKKSREQGEFLIHLPHQYMMLLLAEVEKAGFSGAMDFYCHSRRNSIVASIRNQYAEMKATNKRSVFGIPLDERLLKHPAFQPLLDHTTRNRI